jgi:type VI secretion system protein ImpC
MAMPRLRPRRHIIAGPSKKKGAVMTGRINFEVSLGESRAPRKARRSEGVPARILILGDFSGQAGADADQGSDISGRRARLVDLDTFDDVFEAMSPRAEVAHSDGQHVALEFRSLEDFHPDQLYKSLEAFQGLRTSRARLKEPATFAAEAAALLRAGAAPGAATSPVGATGQSQASEQADLLERLLGSATRATSQPTAAGVTDALVARLIAPHIVRGPDPSLGTYLSAVDAAATTLMRRVLHDSGLQALEARWRGLRRLVETLELGDSLEIRILDVARDDLVADLSAAQGQLESTGLYRAIAARGSDAAGAVETTLLVCDYTFGATGDDLELLAHLGTLAQRVGAPLVAAADASLLGATRLDARSEVREWVISDERLAGRWSALRRSAIAPWVGLALPRMLLRQPYGARTDAIDAFAFEELAGTHDHDGYLWGNPALACAELIGRSLIEESNDAEAPEIPLEVPDLPAHIRDVDGERELKPCAEHLLSLRLGEEILKRGLMPLLSYRDRNAVRLLRLQSIADPPAALAG